MAPSLDHLKHKLGDEDVTRDAVEAAVGPAGVEDLRREYFPRWRPNRVHTASVALRAYRRVVVDNGFEASVVRAVAPPDLRLDIAER